jgi:peptide/nickel transport system permease protein
MAGFVVRGVVRCAVLVPVAASLGYLLAASVLHPRAAFDGISPRPPRGAVDARLDELNLNDATPLPERYLAWASGVMRGDFGRTLDGVPVAAEMGRRIGVSLRLLAAGAFLGGVAGVAAGTLGAAGQYRPLDRLTTVGALVVLSVPVVVLAVLLQTGAQWVNDTTGARLFEWTGEYTPVVPGGALDHLGGRLRHLVLPTLTVALGQFAICSRYQRAMMLDVMRAGFVRTAVAKGLSRRQALTRHALRVAVIPAVTFFAYGFAALLAGAAFTEKVFGWHGMGEWLIDSIHRDDVNTVAACTCFVAVLVPAAGLLSDLARAALDPRTRTCGPR